MKTKHEAAVQATATSLAKAITALEAPCKDQDVFELFCQRKETPEIIAAAFLALDNSPSAYADYQVWHPRLRSLRNHPVHGKDLFALWR